MVGGNYPRFYKTFVAMGCVLHCLDKNILKNLDHSCMARLASFPGGGLEIRLGTSKLPFSAELLFCREPRLAYWNCLPYPWLRTTPSLQPHIAARGHMIVT